MSADHVRHLAVLLSLLAGACAWMPDAGPLLHDVEQEAIAADSRFILVPVDSAVVQAVRSAQDAPNHPAVLAAKLAPLVLGSGDVLTIEVFEAGPAGLFTSAAQPGTTQAAAPPTVSSEVVDEDGSITFPFSGRVHVAGHTTTDAARMIEARLANKMIEPQVSIHIATNASNVVTLAGAIKTPGRPALTAAHEKLLDLIAAAGGPTILPTDASIRLTRRGVSSTFSMQTQLDHPEQDFPAEPGDVIDIINDPRMFIVAGAVVTRLGANKAAQEFPLDVPNLTVENALARAGGVDDERGNARAVLLLRSETPAVLQRLPSLAGRPDLAQSPRAVIYAFDLKTASGLFLANDFPIRARDLVYVPDARLTEFQKIFSILTPLSGPTAAGAAAAR